MKITVKAFVWLCCLCVMTACHQNDVVIPEEEPEETLPPDTLTVMEHLEENGVLHAATSNQLLNFRLLDGQPVGFQFDLLDDFCESIGLRLDLSVNDSLPECYRLLKEDKLDIFAGQIDSIDIDTSFHHIIISGPEETGQTYAWIIAKHEGDTSFLATIELWLKENRYGDVKNSIFRYFKGKEIRYDYTQKMPSSISIYDELIKAEAKKIGCDWRILASIIYQESRFKPDLESEKGAFGLMQLMPLTMQEYGIDYDSSIEEQLAAGGKLLQLFNKELPESISDSLERGNFILASYNAGMGRVLESRHIAEKHGKDPNVWTDNVEFYGPKQTYYFVKEVTKRYSYYKVLIE